MSSSDDDNNLTSDLTKFYNMVFNKSTLLLIIWFLAMHFVCYRLLKFFFNENLDTLDYQSKLSRMLDIAVFSFLLLFLTASYYSVPDKDKETMLETLADSFKTYANDDESIYKTVVFLLLFYCAIYLFRIPMNMETKPAFIAWTEFGAWTLFLIIVFVKFFNDVFGFSMIDIIYSYFNWSELPDTSDETGSVQVADVGEDDEEICDEDEEEYADEEPPSYLSKVLSYVTPAATVRVTKKPSSSNPATLSSVFSNFMTTLASSAIPSVTGSSVTGSSVTGPSVTESSVTGLSVTNAGVSSVPSSGDASVPSANVPSVTGASVPSVTGASVPQTTLSTNISVNTQTTNSLQNSPGTTKASSNISSNTLTTNSLQNTTTSAPQTILSSNITSTTNSASTTTTNKAGFRNMKESFGTMAPSKNVVQTEKSEVFNIAGTFTYDDAQVVCAAYGASLADYDRIEETYNKGGEWCNYGWSAGQYAYFPTQKKTWTKLQQSSDAKIQQSCGRQGINGGYVQDKTKQMGINCYGLKPPPSNKDYELREQQQSVINAKTQQDVELDSKIQYWKQQIDSGTISVNHYNQAVWSNYDTTAPPGQDQSNQQTATTSDQNNTQTDSVLQSVLTTLPAQIKNIITSAPVPVSAINKSVLTTLGPPKMNNPNFNTTKK